MSIVESLTGRYKEVRQKVTTVFRRHAPAVVDAFGAGIIAFAPGARTDFDINRQGSSDTWGCVTASAGNNEIGSLLRQVDPYNTLEGMPVKILAQPNGDKDSYWEAAAFRYSWNGIPIPNTVAEGDRVCGEIGVTPISVPDYPMTTEYWQCTLLDGRGSGDPNVVRGISRLSSANSPYYALYKDEGYSNYSVYEHGRSLSTTAVPAGWQVCRADILPIFGAVTRDNVVRAQNREKVRAAVHTAWQNSVNAPRPLATM